MKQGRGAPRGAEGVGAAEPSLPDGPWSRLRLPRPDLHHRQVRELLLLPCRKAAFEDSPRFEDPFENHTFLLCGFHTALTVKLPRSRFPSRVTLPKACKLLAKRQILRDSPVKSVSREGSLVSEYWVPGGNQTNKATDGAEPHEDSSGPGSVSDIRRVL